MYQGIAYTAWYAKGFDGSAELRQQLSQIESVEQGVALLNAAISQLSDGRMVLMPAVACR